ncbi:hypothetical protein NM688_g7175 [Phlebia brevispora]|uniref:Uncharacterized protein n=1 Tax=Phlebia brevispora TaxID=194682 RepID=A0ACC1S8A8_9APHY|nr:hypothetical protein NM688_g7175 [Phlebia brevispora]
MDSSNAHRKPTGIELLLLAAEILDAQAPSEQTSNLQIAHSPVQASIRTSEDTKVVPKAVSPPPSTSIPPSPVSSASTSATTLELLAIPPECWPSYSESRSSNGRSLTYHTHHPNRIVQYQGKGESVATRKVSREGRNKEEVGLGHEALEELALEDGHSTVNFLGVTSPQCKWVTFGPTRLLSAEGECTPCEELLEDGTVCSFKCTDPGQMTRHKQSRHNWPSRASSASTPSLRSDSMESENSSPSSTALSSPLSSPDMEEDGPEFMLIGPGGLLDFSDYEYAAPSTGFGSFPENQYYPETSLGVAQEDTPTFCMPTWA